MIFGTLIYIKKKQETSIASVLRCFTCSFLLTKDVAPNLQAKMYLVLVCAIIFKKKNTSVMKHVCL